MWFSIRSKFLHTDIVALSWMINGGSKIQLVRSNSRRSLCCWKFRDRSVFAAQVIRATDCAEYFCRPCCCCSSCCCECCCCRAGNIKRAIRRYASLDTARRSNPLITTLSLSSSSLFLSPSFCPFEIPPRRFFFRDSLGWFSFLLFRIFFFFGGEREGIVIYCLGCCCLVAQAFVSHVFIGINSWDSLEDSSGLFIFRREEKFPRDLFSSFFSLSYYSYFFIDTFLMRTFFTGFFPIFSFLEFVDKDSWDNILWIR